ncbi:MAG: hypothetical protein NZ765_00405 [Anaerolineae bacterium]|nr:hypothetical protein [Anaerolineae bacterium]MDW8070089.1 hypothetical protein [Anaerolineae bacterium]
MDAPWQTVAYLVASMLLRLAAERVALFIQANVPQHHVWTHFGFLLLRFSYYIGFPYIALLLGALPARYLGLVGLEQLPHATELSTASGLAEPLRIAIAWVLHSWLPHLGQWAGLTIVMAGLLAAVWRLYRYARHATQSNLPPPDMSSSLGDLTALVTVVYAAVHWGFYRAGIWWLSDDLYLGVVGGVALVLTEWGLCAWLAGQPWRRLSSERSLVEASLLVTTATVFYYVPNLWLLIPTHWLLARLCQRLVAASPNLAYRDY